MKYLISLVFLCILFIGNLQSQELQFTPVHDYDAYFQEAYQTYPNVPVGILEAISYTQTHIRDVNRNHVHGSCAGIPHYYGVMGLIKDGKGWFNNNLKRVAVLSNTAPKIIQSSPRENIMAYAKAYSTLLIRKNITNPSPDAHLEVLNHLSELPNDGSVGSDFAFDTYLYSVFSFLDNEEFRTAYNIPDYNLNLPHIFGMDNYHILSSCEIKASLNEVTNENGSHYNGNVMRSSFACSDTNIPVVYTAADPSNYSSRNGTAITHVTIHTMQGSYSGSISWFQNPSANVSAHYNIRASDGQITQMVCEIDKAWHVSNSNPYAIGIEHEGYVDDPTWYTDVMYQASANLTIDICSRNNIPIIRTYDVNGDTGLNPLGDGCFKVKGHQHFPNQSHTDPGQYWDWNKYYDLLNPPTSVTTNTYTSCSGTFQDPGGNGNSGDDEREFYLIQPSGESTITLNFTSFNLETNYDYLYVYDGDSYNDSLIAVLNGTALPSALTAYSGAMFLEFRTDCATTSAGWTANWSCGVSNGCGTPSGLSQSNESINEVNFSWAAVSGATSYTFRIKRNIENTWEYHTVNTNSISIGGLAVDGYYLWGVSSNCGGSQSPYNGTDFTNTGFIVGSTTTTNCSGVFTDTGGNLANYHNNEDLTYTIAPTGASEVTLSFTAFELESNYDFMKIYDGPNTSSLLLGTYSGSNSPGTVVSSGGALTIEFTSDNWTTKPGWTAIWSCNSSDSSIPTTEIGTISNWVTNDFNLGFNDADDNQVAQRFYQVCDYDGTEWTSNSNNGFFNDDFNILSSEWTSYAGTWNVNAGELLQTDQASSNTILSADLAQNGSTTYLYHWNSNISGTGTNKRAGLHFFCDSPSLSNRGNSYFVYYRVDGNLLQIYEVNSNTFSLVADIPVTFTANVNYDFKVLYNPVTGKIDVFVDDVLAGSWTDSTPLTSGSYVSFRSGNCNYSIKDFRVYQSRGTNETITVGSSNSDDINEQSANPTAFAGKVRSIVLDGSDNMSVTDESDFKVDYTTPSNPSNLQVAASDISTVSGSWNAASDPHSGIDYYEYSIGTSSGSSNILNWTSSGSSIFFNESGLTLNNGQTYYVNVRATNTAGLISNVTSSSFTTNFGDSTPPSTSIGSMPDWATGDFNLSFSDTDNDQVSQRFYQVCDFDGANWYSNSNNGFFNDDFNILSSDWSSYAGAWSISGNSLYQSDESSGNTKLSASLNQTANHSYLYHWTSSIGGSGNNRRAGLHFFCDNPSVSNRNNSYFIYYRIDSDLLQVYEVNSNTYSLVENIPHVFNLNQTYDFKIIFNPSSGKMDVFVDDVLVVSWTDSSPHQSGSYVSFRNGNCTYTVNDFRVYQSRSTNETITVGASNSDDIREQSGGSTAMAGRVRSIVVDASDNMSSIAEQDFKVDYTAPSGLNNIVGAADESSITGSWNTVSEPHSGLDYYEYSIGTTVGGTDISPWNYNGVSTSFTETGLSLVAGQNYYINVRATNMAGLVATSSSSAFSYDNVCTYTQLYNDDFESGWGVWNWGGSNSRRSIFDANYANSGSYCIRLRDNTSASKITTDAMDLTAYEEVRIDFTYLARSMDNVNEDFWLQISYGGSFTTIEEWNRGDEFNNNWRKFDSVTIPGPFTNNMKFRFRCDASGIYDWIYLDDIKIYGCSNASAKMATPEVVTETVDNAEKTNILSDVNLFPNPVKDVLHFEYNSSKNTNIQIMIMDISGQVISSQSKDILAGKQSLDMNISGWNNGYYLLYISDGVERVPVKFLKL